MKRNYEEIATDFDNTRKKELWPEIKKLTLQVKAGSKVLDVGCGNGRLAGVFLGKRIRYLGVDNSKELVEVAKKNFKSVIARSTFATLSVNCATKQSPINIRVREIAALPRVKRAVARNNNNNYKFILGNILELNKLLEKDFDYVFCLAVLHHLPGKDLRIKALKQMKNKLGLNGKIVLTVWNLWSQAKFRELIFKYGLLKLIGKNKMDLGDILFDWKNSQSQSVSRRYYHAFILSELKELAVRVGLKIEKLYKDGYNYYLILIK